LSFSNPEIYGFVFVILYISRKIERKQKFSFQDP
jgi:hypothetical protein